MTTTADAGAADGPDDGIDVGVGVGVGAAAGAGSDSDSGAGAGASSGAILVVTGMRFEVKIAAGPDVEVFSRGPGGALERRLAARLLRPCAGVISFGVAGGLAPSLPPGAVVVADSVAHLADVYDTDVAWSAALRAALPQSVGGVLVAGDQAVASVVDKQRLHDDSGALAVDMESHIAARLSLGARVPFAVCRVVLDPALQAVPSAAVAALADDGSADIATLLRVLVREPTQLIGLLRLARDAGLARRALRAARVAIGASFAYPFIG